MTGTNPRRADLISRDRLAPYLREAGGDEGKALELYKWNAEISASCMEVLAYLELVLEGAGASTVGAC